MRLERSEDFRSDTRYYNVYFAKLCLVGAVLLFVAVCVGQWRANRFPHYPDMIIAPLFVLPVFVFLAFIAYVAAAYFKISVNATSLRCYNTVSRYETISWGEITGASVVSVYSMPYILVFASRLSRPLTIPVWLRDLQDFNRLVQGYAGAGNPLSVTLNEVLAARP